MFMKVKENDRDNQLMLRFSLWFISLHTITITEYTMKLWGCMYVMGIT